MKIVMFGGETTLGRYLAHELLSDAHQLVMPTQDLALEINDESGLHFLFWNANDTHDLKSILENSDIVLNLTACQYSQQLIHTPKSVIDQRKKMIAQINQAINQCEVTPYLWLELSSLEVYSSQQETIFDEYTTLEELEKGSDENQQMWIDFEKYFHHEELPMTRKIMMRLGSVMSLDPHSLFFVYFKNILNRKQLLIPENNPYLQWIHEYDFIRAIYWIIHCEDFDTRVNIIAPESITFEDWVKSIKKEVNQNFEFDQLSWLENITSQLFRNKSTKVYNWRHHDVRAKLLELSRFKYFYPDVSKSSDELIRRWKKTN
jgi:hypothetical protein